MAGIRTRTRIKLVALVARPIWIAHTVECVVTRWHALAVRATVGRVRVARVRFAVNSIHVFTKRAHVAWRAETHDVIVSIEANAVVFAWVRMTRRFCRRRT